MLSLCQRAGELVSGELSAEKALRASRAYLIIIAQDAANNTKEKFKKKAFYYNVPTAVCSDMQKLGHSIGKDCRAVIAVCNANFAEKIKELIDVDCFI